MNVKKQGVLPIKIQCPLRLEAQDILWIVTRFESLESAMLVR